MPKAGRIYRLAREIQEQLTKYHQLFDIYNSYEGVNNLKTINDLAGIAPVKVDRKLLLCSFLLKSNTSPPAGCLILPSGRY